jgi:hypothetical protein
MNLSSWWDILGYDLYSHVVLLLKALKGKAYKHTLG